MQAKIEAFYELILARKAHAFAIYFTVATILLISIGGIFSSSTIGILTILGLLTFQFDTTACKALINPKVLLPIILLLGCVLLWQGLGLVFRDPTDPGAASVLGSAVAIAMLLPVLLAAMQRDASFRDRLLTVLFVVGTVAAVVSIARYFIILEDSRRLTLKGILHSRLVPIGRASHEILGSGGLAACFFAGLALYPKAPLHHRRLIPVGLVLIALTIAMTQSRGPMIGMSLAIVATCIVTLFRSPGGRAGSALALTPMCFLIPVGMIASEPWIKSLACTTKLSVCRPSNRQDVWSTVVGMIQERPWFGIGPSFRFPEGAVSHPHNGILGLIFYFGMPMGFLFLGIIAFAVSRAAKSPPSASRTFALLGIFFSMSFVATDLSNPFAFVNTLYLYLWLPVFMGAILGSQEYAPSSSANFLDTSSHPAQKAPGPC
jgi:O-antigen ligase